MVITSKDNKRIKEVRKLLTKKGRTKSKQFLIEGEHLIEEAIKWNVPIIEVFVLEDTFSFDVKTTIVSNEVMSTLSTLTTPPGIIAVVEFVDKDLKSNRVLALDRIQDPGNLGTLIRTADAFNFKQILIGQGTVDPYSDKVIRSAQGSHFHVDVQFVNLVDEIHQFNGHVLTTDLNGECDLPEVNTNLMIVLGNEGQGVSEAVLNASDLKVKIDMPGNAESLNVSIAGGILMHQYRL